MTNAVDNLDFPTRLEWQGKFAEMAGQGALFSLYLALQYGANASTPTITPIPASTIKDSDFPARLNHYRRPPLSLKDAHPGVTALKSTSLAAGNTSDARWYEACHPEPLSVYNDAKRLPDNVIANCSFATQQRQQQPIQHHIDEDNTMLASVIESARAYA